MFEALHDRLRQQWRSRIGKAPEPSAAVIDAQSTRSTAQGGDTGFDAGKKVKGRKRHRVVDTLGLLLAMTLTAASVHKRWVVERTHAWSERARRLMADHDRSNRAPVAWVWLAQARILATRLTG